MKPRAYPFFRPSEGIVDAAPWALLDPDRNQPPEDGISGWDYSLRLQFGRSFSVDGAELSGRCLLTGAAYQVIVQSLTGPRALREELWRSELLSDEPYELDIEVSPDSSRLHESLLLQTSLVLARPGRADHPASPVIQGSRLWSDETRIDLAGSLGRFGMTAAPFGDLFPDSPNALWHLEWVPERLDESTASVQLILNSDRQDLVENLDNPITVSTMLTDIVLQMIIPVLSDPDSLAEIDDYAEGTVGGLIHSWITRLEEGTPRESLSEMAQNSLGQLTARVQSRMTRS